MNKKDTESRLRRILQKRLTALKSAHIPRGLSFAADDLFINVVEYDGYIAGLVSSLLDHDKINIEPQSVKLTEHLQTLEKKHEAISKELRKYNRTMEKLAKTYVEYISIK